jgi:multiple sugar transport system permease protein
MLATYISRIKKYCSFNNKNFVGILFIVPCLVFLVLVAVYPALFAVKMSFYNWKLTCPDKIVKFVGIKNYISVLTNYRFWNSLKITSLFFAITISIEFVLGISIALLLNRDFKGKSIARALFILPMVVCPLSAGILFRVMYHPQYGIINQILNLFSIAPKMWLSSPSTALISIVLCEVWQSAPFVLLVSLAGLEMLPGDLLEAAIVDGANSVQRFFYVTLPLLSKLLVLVFIIRAIDIIKIFDSVYVMTKGGPGISTEVLGLYIYKEGFNFFNTSYANAVSVIVMVIFGGIIVLWSKSSREENVVV